MKKILLITFGLVVAGCETTKSLLPHAESTSRIEVHMGQTTASARVGDVLYLEVGAAVSNPDQLGYEVTLDGRRLSQGEWHLNGRTLEYVYRAVSLGTHHVEVVAKGEEHARKHMDWDITVLPASPPASRP